MTTVQEGAKKLLETMEKYPAAFPIEIEGVIGGERVDRIFMFRAPTGDEITFYMAQAYPVEGSTPDKLEADKSLLVQCVLPNDHDTMTMVKAHLEQYPLTGGRAADKLLERCGVGLDVKSPDKKSFVERMKKLAENPTLESTSM